jgi:thioredoxin 1
MKPVEVTDANFQTEVLNSDKPVLLDFWAEWCGPCKMIAPLVEELAKEYDGKLKVGKVDVDSNQQVSMQFGIRSIPTLLIFKGGRVVEQVIGAVPKKMLVEKVSKHLN